MTQWHHSFLGLGPGHSRRRGRQLKRAQPGAGGECPPDMPRIGFTSVLFRAAVSWRHIWMLGGCAAAPWSCAASRLSTPIGEGFVRHGWGCCRAYTARSGIGFSRWGSRLGYRISTVGSSMAVPLRPGVAQRRGFLRRSAKASVHGIPCMGGECPPHMPRIGFH